MRDTETQPSSPRKQNIRPHFSMREIDGQPATDEHALLRAFLDRRRRMETASRLTDKMMAQVSSIMDSDENTTYALLIEDMTSTRGATQDLRKTSVGLTFGEDNVMIGGPSPLLNSPEAILEHETNSKVNKMRDMRAEQRKAAELQEKPEFQLAEPSLEMPKPPLKFTSTSLAFALETLATSVTKIVSATDGILLQLSELDKEMTPPVMKEIGVLSLHVQHACRCYAAAMQHLSQYEVCDKALQDGTAQELSILREKFLMRKEMLTAQEQKQKVTEEHLQALKLRLNGIDARCRMWSAILLDNPTPPQIITSPLWIGNRTSLSRERDSMSFVRPLSSSRGASITQRVGSAGGLLPRRRSSARLYTPMTENSMESLSTSSTSHDELDSRVDAMEIKVARFWRNPYVIKAQRCSERLRRRRRRMKEQSSPIVDTAWLPVIQRSDSVVGLGSSLRGAPDTQRQSRLESIRKVSAIVEGGGGGKAAAEVRLTALLRSLMRLVPRPSGDGEATAEMSGESLERETSIGREKGGLGAIEEVEVEGRVEEDGSISPIATSSLADGSAVPTTAEVCTGARATSALSKSVKSLLKFLDASHAASL